MRRRKGFVYGVALVRVRCVRKIKGVNVIHFCRKGVLRGERSEVTVSFSAFRVL